MEKAWEQEFWKKMEDNLKQINEEVALQKTQDGRTVLFALFTTMREGKGVALFETQIYDYGTHGKIVEIVVTPREFRIKEEAMQEVEKTVARLNHFMPMGAYGVHEPSKQLFLRYVLPVEEDVAAFVEKVRKLYEFLGMIFGNLYPSMEAICKGESTYEKEVEATRLPAQS